MERAYSGNRTANAKVQKSPPVFICKSPSGTGIPGHCSVAVNCGLDQLWRCVDTLPKGRKTLYEKDVLVGSFASA